MGWKRAVGWLAGVAIALVLAGCQASFRPDMVRTQSLDYATAYPLYAELCALSQFRKRPGFEPPIIGGGFGGHEVLYLNGACRVKDAHYPVLTPCTGGGVGISVNAHYKNANWVATEGRDFFFNGGLGPSEPLTREAYERALAHAKETGLLDGIEFHREVFAKIPAGDTEARYMYEVSVGTDFAIKFARDRYCARVPLTPVQMARAVDYLNGVNAPYRAGQKEFRWDVFKDNCSHLLRNALAAAGVWEPWEVGRPRAIAMFDFPTPKNEFVNLMHRTNDTDLNLESLYNDPVAREMVLNGNGLPVRPGALAEIIHIADPNDLYDTDIKLIFNDEPLVGRYQRRLNRILKEPRYTDIDANRAHFRDLYRRIEAARRPLSYYEGRHTGWSVEDRARFASFYTRYYQAVAAETARLNSVAAR